MENPLDITSLTNRIATLERYIAEMKLNVQTPISFIKTGTAEILFPGVGNQEIVTIPHNLGYTPSALVYYQSPDGVIAQFDGIIKTFYGEVSLEVQAVSSSWVDSNNLYVSITNSSVGMGIGEIWGVKYYLFTAPATGSRIGEPWVA